MSVIYPGDGEAVMSVLYPGDGQVVIPGVVLRHNRRTGHARPAGSGPRIVLSFKDGALYAAESYDGGSSGTYGIQIKRVPYNPIRDTYTPITSISDSHSDSDPDRDSEVVWRKGGLSLAEFTAAIDTLSAGIEAWVERVPQIREELVAHELRFGTEPDPDLKSISQEEEAALDARMALRGETRSIGLGWGDGGDGSSQGRP